MRVIVLSLAVLAVWATAARAEIRVIDPATGASTTLLDDDRSELIRWADDGSALLIRTDYRVVRLGLDAAKAEEPRLSAAWAIGPGGRTISTRGRSLRLHAPDGRVIATQRASDFLTGDDVAWSADGGRVAVADIGEEHLLVLDTATGAAVLRRKHRSRLTQQAFAPDGSALAITEGSRVLRVELPSGTASVLRDLRTRDVAYPAVWSATGRIAITRYDGIGLLGSPGIPVPTDPSRPAQWSPDGQTLAFVITSTPSDRCANPVDGVGVAAPGQPARVLIEPSERSVNRIVWAPDGSRLAVELGPENAVPEPKRGKRHAWPQRIARDYAMYSAAGDAAMRRIVVRASRALRSGLGREATLRQVRGDYGAAAARFGEAGDTEVEEAVADEIDGWLDAAGYQPLDAHSEMTC